MNSQRIENILDKIKLATSIKDLAKDFLWSVAKELDASQGAFFIAKERENIHYLQFIAGYAYHLPESESIEFEFGEGLSGQVAKEDKLINIQTVPDGYIKILSGLGNASPTAMIIFPVRNNNKVVGVVEMASFKKFTEEDEQFIKELSVKLEDVLAQQITN
jgi:putative methionine-R-sulfoxide reductase with GAF domain